MENDASPKYVFISLVILAICVFDVLYASQTPVHGVVASKEYGAKGTSSMEVKQERGGLYTYHVEAKILANVQEGREVKIYQSALFRRTLAVEQGNNVYNNGLSRTNMLLYGIMLSLGSFVGGYAYLLLRSRSAS